MSTARTAGSACAALSASVIAAYIAIVSAFFFSGRAISMVITPFDVAVRMLMSARRLRGREGVHPINLDLRHTRAARRGHVGELLAVLRKVVAIRAREVFAARRLDHPCAPVPAAVALAVAVGIRNRDLLARGTLRLQFVLGDGDVVVHFAERQRVRILGEMPGEFVANAAKPPAQRDGGRLRAAGGIDVGGTAVGTLPVAAAAVAARKIRSARAAAAIGRVGPASGKAAATAPGAMVVLAAARA